jgi:hypothetical protein
MTIFTIFSKKLLTFILSGVLFRENIGEGEGL